jgi:hypothetical protein
LSGGGSAGTSGPPSKNEKAARRCATCDHRLPPVDEQSWISLGTGLCSFHAKGRVIAVYLSSAASRAWLRDWEQRFHGAALAADVIPDSLLTSTRFLE